MLPSDTMWKVDEIFNLRSASSGFLTFLAAVVAEWGISYIRKMQIKSKLRIYGVCHEVQQFLVHAPENGINELIWIKVGINK